MLFTWVLRTTLIYAVTCFKAEPSSTMIPLLSRSVYTSSVRQFHPPKLRF
ncbi:hypothetical protein Bca101_058600 [Brassica carinata]